MKKVSISVPQSGWGTMRTKYPPHSLFVRADDLTGATQNADSSVHGSLTKRQGIVSAFVPHNIIKDQFEAIFSDGVRHLLMVGNGVLEYAASTSGSTIVTSGYSALGNFEFGQYNDRVYFDNGINAPQVYDRETVYGGVTYTAPRTKVMGAQAPTTAPTFAADTAGGNVPAGAHTYKVTFEYYGFEESNGGPASVVHTVVNPNNTVNLTAVPTGGYGVTARKIYRDNNDGAWLFVGSIQDNTTTTFQDAAAVGTSSIPADNDVPPSFRFIEVHLDHIWIAGVPGDPTGLYFSNAGEPDIFPAENRIGCNPEDPIAAIFQFNGRIFVLNQNSMGEILGQTSDTFYYSPLSPTVGCADNRSIRVRVVDGVPQMVWLSNKGPYMTNGWVIQYIGDPIEDLITLNIQQTAQIRGQDAEATQEAFSEGTASPAIDLDVVPNAVTVENPKRVWQSHSDWIGGSSLTNVVTEDGSNNISVPTASDLVIGDGTLAGNAEDDGSGNVNLPVYPSTYTGEDHYAGGGTILGVGNGRAVKVVIPRAGTVNSFKITLAQGVVGGSNTFNFKIWSDSFGLPGPVVYASSPFVVSNNSFTLYSFSLTQPLSAGTYWIGVDSSDFPPSVSTLSGDGVNWAAGASATFSGGVWHNATPNQLDAAFTFTQAAVSTAGQWQSPVLDTQILVGASVGIEADIIGSYPSPSTGTLLVQSSDDPAFGTVATTDTFVNPTGTVSVAGFGHRYWRMTLQLSTTDDRLVPDMSIPVLEFNPVSVWISEVIDHTTDITSLDSLTIVDTVPVGTSVVLEIATSADNITYTSFGPIGSAVVQRYSKIRVTMTASTDDVVSPTVTSVTFAWSVVANLVSRVIDMGAIAAWDVFQVQFTLPPGADFHIYLKSASTILGLAGATYFEVFNGTYPGVPINEFAQWKVIITAHADEVPVLTSVTVNWLLTTTNAPRVASLFYSRSYYLAAAEYNNLTNNIIFVMDWEGKWRVYRNISISTLSLFFNAPFANLADQALAVKFLAGAPNSPQDLADPIEMIIQTKAFDFGDVEHYKICRKIYIKATVTNNTHSTWSVAVSFDNGNTFVDCVDPITGSSSWITPDQNGTYVRRFIPPFTLGQNTFGRTMLVDIREATFAPAQLDAVKVEAWVRSGELVQS